MIQPVCTNKSPLYFLYIVLSLISIISLLSFSACECIGLYGGGSTSAKTVEQDVNSSMIDTDDATEVNIAIATEQVIGDEKAAGALIVSKYFKAQDNITKAGLAFDIEGNPEKGVKHYEEALKWLDQDDHQNRLAIHYALAREYERGVNDPYGWSKEKDNWDPNYLNHKAAENYAAAGEDIANYIHDNEMNNLGKPPDNYQEMHRQGSCNHFNAAYYFYKNGEKTLACKNFKFALSAAEAGAADQDYIKKCKDMMEKTCK